MLHKRTFEISHGSFAESIQRNTRSARELDRQDGTVASGNHSGSAAHNTVGEGAEPAATGLVRGGGARGDGVAGDQSAAVDHRGNVRVAARHTRGQRAIDIAVAGDASRIRNANRCCAAWTK